MGDEMPTKIKVYRVITLLMCAVYILLTGFFLWQLIVGIQAGSPWGIGANVLMIVALFVIGIIGIIGIVRKGPWVLATFACCCIVVFLFALVELIVTILGEVTCTNSGEPNPVWDFLCENSSWVLIIPLSILLFISVVGGVFAMLFIQGTKTNEATGGKDNYYH